MKKHLAFLLILVLLTLPALTSASEPEPTPQDKKTKSNVRYVTDAISDTLADGTIDQRHAPAALAGLDRLAEALGIETLSELARVYKKNCLSHGEVEGNNPGMAMLFAEVARQKERLSDPDFKKPVAGLLAIPELADLHSRIQRELDSLNQMTGHSDSAQANTRLKPTEVRLAKHLRAERSRLLGLAPRLNDSMRRLAGRKDQLAVVLDLRRHLATAAALRQLAFAITLYERELSRKKPTPTEPLADMRNGRAFVERHMRDNETAIWRSTLLVVDPDYLAVADATIRYYDAALAELKRH